MMRLEKESMIGSRRDAVPIDPGRVRSLRGVLMAPGVEENWTISVQHSEDDVQHYVDNFAEMARDLRA